MVRETPKKRAVIFAYGLLAYAMYMNSRLGGLSEQLWHQWQEDYGPLDEEVMDFYYGVFLPRVNQKKKL